MNKSNLLALLQRPAMDPEELEFRAWLKNCAGILAGRDSFEVAHMAILVGWPQALVTRVLVDFQDAMAGSCLENRAVLKAFQLEHAIDQFTQMRRDLETPKPTDLQPLWEDVHRFQTEGVDFPEGAWAA